ncbi:putative leucine-rich repeat domain, L domain-containing protein [Medicago truncatula]|uniref:Putative leucine-rich repeat domain, L domain-containing protein n=1 Tax=Medicago truncatula TaxID=3880 RepID=A0A396HGG0_MEDTR|nr:putative leucine-rich repeat domain, L domain-containing protein [Medicago truncatula]
MQSYSCVIFSFRYTSAVKIFCDVDNIFRLISSFPLKKLTFLVFTGEPRFPFKKLKSLVLSGESIFPADGLRVFSQNITTLTSLTCSINFLYKNDLLLIADCFPLLKELNIEINNPIFQCQTNFKNGTHSLLSKRQLVNNRTDFINEIHSLLSNCRFIQHLNLECTFFLNDTHVAGFSLFLGDLVSINLNHCSRLTESAVFSLVRNCPSLSEIKMQNTAIGTESVENSDVYPQLKSLYLGRNFWLSNENIIRLASFFPNLQLLDLYSNNNISEGICQVFRRCDKIKHLN